MDSNKFDFMLNSVEKINNSMKRNNERINQHEQLAVSMGNFQYSNNQSSSFLNHNSFQYIEQNTKNNINNTSPTNFSQNSPNFRQKNFVYTNKTQQHNNTILSNTMNNNNNNNNFQNNS